MNPKPTKKAGKRVIKAWGVMNEKILFVAYPNFPGGRKEIRKFWNKKSLKIVPCTLIIPKIR